MFLSVTRIKEILPDGSIYVSWSPSLQELKDKGGHFFTFDQSITDAELDLYEQQTARPQIVIAVNEYFGEELYT